MYVCIVRDYPFVYVYYLTARGPIAVNVQKGAATVFWHVNALLISPEEELCPFDAKTCASQLAQYKYYDYVCIN